jgi:type I restriction enzyme S subunit
MSSDAGRQSIVIPGPPQISLKDALEFIVDNRGKTAPTEPTGIALIATNCVNNDDLYPRKLNLRYVSQDTYKNWFRSHPRPGDILLTNKGSQNGAVCLVPDPVDFCIAQDMVAMRADRTKIDPLYLFAALRSDLVQKRIKALNVDGVIPHIKKTDFNKILIPYPNMSSQKLIGEIYFSLSSRIELLRETNTTLGDIARTLFKSWFVDFHPVHAKRDGRVPEGMDEATAALFPNSFETRAGQLMPAGWEKLPFTDTVHVVGGGTPKTTNSDYWNGNIPWYSVVDAPLASDVFVMATKKNITQAGLDNSSTKLLAEGTTIISARGTVGRLALVGCPMTMNQSCYGLRGKSGDSYYTYFSTSRLVESLKQRSHGSVFDTITTETMKSLSVVHPPVSVIDAFEETLVPLMDRIKTNLLQAQSLVGLRDTLLPRLISRQLPLSETAELMKHSA